MGVESETGRRHDASDDNDERHRPGFEIDFSKHEDGESNSSNNQR
jgi:hypothetical protein